VILRLRRPRLACVPDLHVLKVDAPRPQVGGALNAPGSCAPPNVTHQSRLGDIAVTPYSVNWQCKLASWTEQCTGYPNICNYPIEEAGPLVTYALPPPQSPAFRDICSRVFLPSLKHLMARLAGGIGCQKSVMLACLGHGPLPCSY
jgi:hypothetical protein